MRKGDELGYYDPSVFLIILTKQLNFEGRHFLQVRLEWITQFVLVATFKLIYNHALMYDFVALIFIHTFVRVIGQYVRYLFFSLIGRKKTFRSLSDVYKSDYKDMGKALVQDFWNAVVGTIVLGVATLIIVGIVFGWLFMIYCFTKRRKGKPGIWEMAVCLLKSLMHRDFS